MGKARNRQLQDGRGVNNRDSKVSGEYYGTKSKWEEDRVSKGKAVHIQPKTFNQELFLRSMRENIITVGSGSSGVGKSFLACYYAASELLAGNIQKIVITRPYVAVSGRTTGFKPNTDIEKLRGFVLPMLGYLSEVLGKGMVEQQLQNADKIELAPLESIRGRSFDNAFVICDESSNLTQEELKAICTRIGKNTRLILIGDNFQTDTRHNGLQWFEMVAEKYNIPDVGVVKFNHNDIVRSGIVRDLVIAFEKECGYKG